MTTADAETTKRRPAAARGESTAPLSAELVDAGSAALERGARIVRNAAESGLKVTDVVVLGTLGLAEEWVSATPVAGLAVPPVKIARDTWGATREGLRELVAAV